MIVDTSALSAIVFGEPGWAVLREALYDSGPMIPANVLTELKIVTSRRSARDRLVAETLLQSLLERGMPVISFEQRHAIITGEAWLHYGKGNGAGGTLNFGDLMVYAIARQRGQPLLCTGSDFAATDLDLHPASRLTP